jgi:release factor glutamine methyltransferase
VRILTIPGVFKPPSDCWLLADAVRERGLASGARALDVFTGSGALAVASARAGARDSTAIDVSRRAVLCARVNGRLNGVRVRALRGDLFAPVRGERFDLVTANPPYVPGDPQLPSAGPARAWEGGRDGRVLVDRFLDGVPSVLAPGGAVVIVHSHLTGERATLDRLAAGGLEPEVLVRQRGPFGRIVQGRRAELEAAGLLAPEEHEEEMLVMIGRAPR